MIAVLARRTRRKEQVGRLRILQKRPALEIGFEPSHLDLGKVPPPKGVTDPAGRTRRRPGTGPEPPTRGLPAAGAGRITRGTPQVEPPPAPRPARNSRRRGPGAAPAVLLGEARLRLAGWNATPAAPAGEGGGPANRPGRRIDRLHRQARRSRRSCRSRFKFLNREERKKLTVALPKASKAVKRTYAPQGFVGLLAGRTTAENKDRLLPAGQPPTTRSSVSLTSRWPCLPAGFDFQRPSACTPSTSMLGCGDPADSGHTRKEFG